MKELELEAEEYVNLNWGGYKDDLSQISEQLTLGEISKKDFIAGATSKYVEKQKLEFAIEQLNYLHNLLTYDDLAEDEKIESCKEYIQDLQKKLLNL